VGGTALRHDPVVHARPASRRRVAVALAVFTIIAVGPIVAPYSAQPASRYALTAALSERHTVDLGGYARILGVDHAVYKGRLRSDKPPGQPLLGVPFYWMGRLVGLRPAADLRPTGDLGLWWQTLWGAMVPFAALLVAMYLVASRFAARRALPATLALGFGTLALPHTVNLYGHSLAALLAYGSWCMLDRADGDRVRLACVGLLLASAIAVEYHTAIIGLAVAVVAAARNGRRAAVLALGAAPVTLATLLYQRAAFGQVWRVPYGYYGGQPGQHAASGGGYAMPSLRQLADIFTGVHGLLFVSPVVVVGLVAAARLARQESGALRTHALLALAVFVPYWVLIAGWSGTPILEQPGPRYLIPALPFLAVPLAMMWERLRPWAVLATAWGVVVMAAGSVTFHLVAPNDAPARVYVGRVLHREFARTLWSMAFGRAGGVLYVSTVGLAVAVVVSVARADGSS
jgi:hypothetical protein